MTDEADPTLDPRQANFRRRAAFWSMAHLAAVSAGLFLREKDIPTNAASILEWMVFADAVVIFTAIGAKAVEQLLIARAGGPKP